MATRRSLADIFSAPPSLEEIFDGTGMGVGVSSSGVQEDERARARRLRAEREAEMRAMGALPTDEAEALGTDPGVVGPAARRFANSATGWLYGLAERVTPESVIPTGTREAMKESLEEERLASLTHGNDTARALALGGADFAGTLTGGVLVPGASARAAAVGGRLAGAGIGAGEGALMGWADTPGLDAREQAKSIGLGALLGAGGGALASRRLPTSELAGSPPTNTTVERRSLPRPSNDELSGPYWDLVRKGASRTVDETTRMAELKAAIQSRMATAEVPQPTPRGDVPGQGFMRGTVEVGRPLTAVGPPVVTPDFQTNLAAQLGDPEVASYIVAKSDEIAKAAGPPVGWDDLEHMASTLGTTKDQFLARPTKYALMPPAERIRLGMVIKGVRDDAATLQAKLAAGTATDDETAHLVNLGDQYGSLIKLAVSSGSEYGRALNSAKMAIRSSLGESDLAKQSLYRRYRDVLDKNPDYLRTMALLDPSNPEELTAWLRNVDPATKGELIQEFWVGNVLSAVGPQERNAIGNLMNAFTENVVARGAKGAADAVHSMTTGRPREAYTVEAAHAAAGAFYGVRRGISKAIEVLKRGYVASEDGKFLPSRNAYKRSQNRVVREYLGPAYTVGLRALSAADVFAKTVNHSAQLYADAARAAIKEGAVDRSARTAELVANPTADMLKRARAFELKATFNDPMSELGKDIMKVRERFGPAGFFVAPFMRIADRMFTRGAEWTPGLGTAKAVKALRREGWTEETADLVGRQAVGAGLLAGAATLALDDRLTASAPDQPAERALFYAQGRKPWSVRVGDVWVPINQLGPLAWPIELVAAAHEGWTKNGEAPNVERLSAAATEMASFVSDQSYMDAWGKFFSAISGSTDAGKALADLTKQTATGFVPLSGLNRTIAQAVDPRLIDIRGIGDAVQSTVPGGSLSMSARLDPWGDEIIPSGGRLRSVMAAGTPLDASREKSDPLNAELDRLGEPLGYVDTRFFDPVAQRAEKLNPADQREYQRLAGSKTRELLTALFSDPGYTSSGNVEAQRTAKDKAIQAARQYARMALLAKRYGWN